MPLTYTKDAFVQALQDAACAHGIFEEALGQGRDQDWPIWYAQHMASQPTDVAASPVLTFAGTGELAQALLHAEAAHAADGDAEEPAEPGWVGWYAEHLLRDQTRAGLDS